MHTVELGWGAYVICRSTIGECAHGRGYLGLLTEWVFSLMMVCLSVMRVTSLNVTLLSLIVRGLQALLGVPMTICVLHGFQAMLGVPTTIYCLHGTLPTTVSGLHGTLPMTIYGLHGLQAMLGGVPMIIYVLHGPQQTLGTAMTEKWLYMYV